MSPTKRIRTRLAQNNRFATRETVYEISDGLEIDRVEQYEVIRRRVLYEDVLLVTLHRKADLAPIIVNAGVALFFFSMALLITKVNQSTLVSLIMAGCGSPFLLLFVIRILFKADVVTVFGRRSKAVMRFPFGSARARRMYGQICARVRQAQSRMEREIADKSPAVEAALSDVPHPPSESEPYPY